MEKIPSFDEVSAALANDTTNSAADPAEIHGLLCGMICSGPKMNGKVLIEPTDKASRSILLRLYEITSSKLHHFDFEFELLLPDDSYELRVQAEGLSRWCQGFLLGLHAAGIVVEHAKSNDTRDALHRIAELAALDHEVIEIKEDDDVALFEVTEYIRLAVLMIYSEFAVTQNGSSDIMPASQMIH